MKTQRVTSIVVALLLLASVTQGGQITPVTVGFVSSELVTAFSRPAVNTVNGSGLNINGPGTHSNVPDGSMWLTTGVTNCCGGTSYVNSPGAGQDDQNIIVFDLGALYYVYSTRVWNYNEVNITGRGFKTTNIAYSSTNLSPGSFTLLTTLDLNQAPGLDSVDFSQVIPLNLNVQARYIAFQAVSQWGTDNGFAGLSEVQFSVPEPASLAVWSVVGLTIGGASWWRRRRSV